MDLIGHLRSMGPMAVAVSGGVDSTYLLAMAVRSGVEVVPFFMDTCFNKRGVRPGVEDLCRSMGVEPRVLTQDVLSVPGVSDNGPDRCYLCKRAMFSAIRDAACGMGMHLVVDGTNASDDEGDRPGMRALRELGVRSPLRECGLTKDIIRDRSRELGLPTWDMPSDSCLATRVLTGNLITDGLLGRVEEAESRLGDMGFLGCRVRTDGRDCLVEVRDVDLPRAVGDADAIGLRLGTLFSTISVSENGR